MLNSLVLLARRTVCSTGRIGAFAVLLAGVALVLHDLNGARAGQPTGHRPAEITGRAEPISSPDGRFELV